MQNTFSFETDTTNEKQKQIKLQQKHDNATSFKQITGERKYKRILLSAVW